MQVILVKSVRKLGKVGQIVKVKDGFGRNYLIPQELAIRASKENIAKCTSIQKELELKNNANKVEAEKAAKLIESKHLNFVVQSAADGRLFGSVSAKMLAEQISILTNYKLNYTNILLDSSIKFNGVYNISVAFHPEAVSSILVVVAKSNSEAQDALREYKEKNRKKEEME